MTKPHRTKKQTRGDSYNMSFKHSQQGQAQKNEHHPLAMGPTAVNV